MHVNVILNRTRVVRRGLMSAHDKEECEDDEHGEQAPKPNHARTIPVCHLCGLDQPAYSLNRISVAPLTRGGTALTLMTCGTSDERGLHRVNCLRGFSISPAPNSAAASPSGEKIGYGAASARFLYLGLSPLGGDV
jgi:hypothetical protein